MAMTEVLTILGSGGLAAIVTRLLAHREVTLRIETAAKEKREKAQREDTERRIIGERKRAEHCESRCAKLEERVEEQQSQILMSISETADLRVQLAHCDERHSAMEERMVRLERQSSRPPEA